MDNYIKLEPISHVSPEQQYRDTYEQALQYAADNKLIVHHPEHNQVLLDLDTLDQENNFESILPLFEEKFKVLNIKKTRSKSGKTHVYINIDRNLTDLERIAIQAILGSDPKRELLSMHGWATGVPYPSLLFETQQEAGA